MANAMRYPRVLVIWMPIGRGPPRVWQSRRAPGDEDSGPPPPRCAKPRWGANWVRSGLPEPCRNTGRGDAAQRTRADACIDRYRLHALSHSSMLLSTAITMRSPSTSCAVSPRPNKRWQARYSICMTEVKREPYRRENAPTTTPACALILSVSRESWITRDTVVWPCHVHLLRNINGHNARSANVRGMQRGRLRDRGPLARRGAPIILSHHQTDNCAPWTP